MSFLDDIIGAVTGQQSVPQQTIIPTGDLLNQAYGTFNSWLPSYLAGQQALATGQTDIGLGVANQIDPNILANFTGANKYYNDQLNLGSSMTPELHAEITKNLLATNAATGFGASPGGTGNVLYQTAADKQALADLRARNALAAGSNGIGISRGFYNPTAPIDAGSIAQDIRGVQAQQDELANLTENIRQKNFSNLLSTGLKIAGTAAGAAFGGGPGAMLGANIGGSIIPGGGVAGFNNQPQQQSNGFGSFLNGITSLFGSGNGGDAGTVPQFSFP